MKKAAAHKQYRTNPEPKKTATHEQYSTNLETIKAAAHEQYSTNPDEKRQQLMSNIVIILRKNRLLPELTPEHVTE